MPGGCFNGPVPTGAAHLVPVARHVVAMPAPSSSMRAGGAFARGAGRPWASVELKWRSQLCEHRVAVLRSRGALEVARAC